MMELRDMEIPGACHDRQRVLPADSLSPLSVSFPGCQGSPSASQVDFNPQFSGSFPQQYRYAHTNIPYYGSVTHRPGQSGSVTHRPGQSGSVTQIPGQSGSMTERLGQSSSMTQKPGNGDSVTQRPGQGDSVTQRLGQGSSVTQRPGQGGSVTHRPWEDSVPYEPRWSPHHFCDSLVGLAGRPKTFKPVLVYQRPEEDHVRLFPRLKPFFGYGGYPVCVPDDDLYYYLHNCHGDAIGDLRDVLHDDLCRMGHGMCDLRNINCFDCNYFCGFPPLLNPKINQSALPGNMCHLTMPWDALGRFGPCCQRHRFQSDDSEPNNTQTPFPSSSLSVGLPSHINPQIPLSVPQKCSFSTSPLTTDPRKTNFPLVSQTAHPAPYFKMFPHHPMGASDRESASEIRRALLMKHRSFADSCNTFDKQLSFSKDVSKHGEVDNSRENNLNAIFQPATEINGRQSTIPVEARAFYPNSSTDAPNHGHPATAPTLTDGGAGPVQATSSQGPAAAPLSSVPDHRWQDWPGKHGSFLQLLNSPECPLPADTGSLPANTPQSDFAEKLLPDTTSFAPSVEALNVAGLTRETSAAALLCPPERDESVIAEDRDYRRHKCPFCNVACTNSGQLKGHLRVHTGERPFICECGRAFARNEELTRHRRIHSGFRPHQCRTCGKSFGRKDHLNKHQKTHLRTSEKKMHVCRVGDCRQQYTRSDALARHQWGAHGIKARTSRIRPVAVPSDNLAQLEKLLASRDWSV